MKKILLGLGTVAAAIAPIATAVACGSEKKEEGIPKPSYDSSTTILLNDITAYTYHPSHFGSGSTEGIEAAWQDIIANAKSADEFIAMMAVAAYPDDFASDPEATLASCRIKMFGGTDSYGNELQGWATLETQRLEKTLIFWDEKETVEYKEVTIEDLGLFPGTSIDYTAQAGEVLIKDWTSFDKYAGVGQSAVDKVNNVWGEIKDQINSYQGLVNSVLYYGYSQLPDGQSDQIVSNVANYITDYIKTTGNKLAFNDGTVKEIAVQDIEITDWEANRAYRTVANANGTTFDIVLGTVQNVTLTSSDELTGLADGATVNVTATANPYFTINGGETETFTATVVAPEEVAAGITVFNFNDASASDFSAEFEAVIAPRETAIKVYSKAGILNGSASSNYNVLKLGSSKNAGAVKYIGNATNITSITVKGAGWTDTSIAIIDGSDFAGTNNVIVPVTKYVGDGNAAIGVDDAWLAEYTFDFSTNPISNSFLVTSDDTVTGGTYGSLVIEEIIITTA